jgi:hypothetical protein
MSIVTTVAKVFEQAEKRLLCELFGLCAADTQPEQITADGPMQLVEQLVDPLFERGPRALIAHETE